MQRILAQALFYAYGLCRWHNFVTIKYKFLLQVEFVFLKPYAREHCQYEHAVNYRLLFSRVVKSAPRSLTFFGLRIFPFKRVIVSRTF